jgi:hypothetical protein
MIEMRVVLHENRINPEIQYRYHIFTVDASGALCPPNPNMKWSEWRTAPYVKAEDIENE